MSIKQDSLEDRNKQLILPADGLLYSADGRKFGIVRWCPKMEAGCETRFEIECVELPENDYYAKQLKTQHDAVQACAALAKLVEIGNRVQQ